MKELSMSKNKIDLLSVRKYFKEGDIVLSGGNRAKIKITDIFDEGIRFQSVTTKTYKGILYYDKLKVVIENFNRIPHNSISKSVFDLLKLKGLFDSAHETNLYGFVREFKKRARV
jgi:hypothetical protein